jgi:hypothetical protein
VTSWQTATATVDLCCNELGLNSGELSPYQVPEMLQELTIEFELLLIKRLATHILLDILPQKSAFLP